MTERYAMRAPTLIVGFGNPSRGDDALGPAALDELESHFAQHPPHERIEFVTDFQLQIEFVTDLVDRQRIVFVDATATGTEPFSFDRLEARQQDPVTSHALSPASLLAVYRSYHGEEAPPSFVLAIRGYDFELGAPVSDRAQRNLRAALAMLEPWLTVDCDQPVCHA